MTLTSTILRVWPDACAEAIAWADQYDDDEGAAAWRDCERGDWMLDIAARMGVDRKAIVRACVDVAAVEVWRWDDVDDRPLAALEAALAWCEGGATIKEVRAAAYAARAAARAAAYAYSAADAAWAATSGAAAYSAASGADAYAVDAAWAAASGAAAYSAASGADAAAAARATSLRLSAEIVRRHVPWRMVRQAITAKGGV